MDDEFLRKKNLIYLFQFTALDERLAINSFIHAFDEHYLHGFFYECATCLFLKDRTRLNCWGLKFLKFRTVRTPTWLTVRSTGTNATPSGSQEDSTSLSFY